MRKGPPAGEGVQSCVTAAKADKNALLLLMKQETSNWGAGGRPASATRPQLNCSWLSASEIQEAKLNPQPCVDDLIHIKYGDNKTIQVGDLKICWLPFAW